MKLWKYGQLSSHSYIGETGREFGQRLGEEKEADNKQSYKKYSKSIGIKGQQISRHTPCNTSQPNQPSHTMQHKPIKSAVTHHATQANQISRHTPCNTSQPNQPSHTMQHKPTKSAVTHHATKPTKSAVTHHATQATHRIDREVAKAIIQ